MNKTSTLNTVFAAILLVACGGSNQIAEVPDSQNASMSDQLVLSTLWFQTSDEAPFITEQLYDLAWVRLAENLQYIQDERHPAIIVDIDETVLDNSPYEARLIVDGEDFTLESWGEWVQEAEAEPIAGAQEFLEKAARRGVEVFYISNRSVEHLKATIQNLAAYDFPYADPEHVLLKGDTSDKTERRETVKRDYEVALLVGDQMTDFAEKYESFIMETSLRDSLDHTLFSFQTRCMADSNQKYMVVPVIFRVRKNPS